MSLNKTAEVKTAISPSSNPQVEMFLRNLKPDPKSVYMHIPAVSAGEYWGANNWGDYFPEDSLKKYHKSFYDARVFRRHDNKDVRKSIGDVVLATYNDKMHRAELVVRIYRELAPDIAEKADKGEPVGFSMGCRVPYEICSYCKTKIYKTKERCDHLKFHMNKTLDGRPVYAINSYPDFFDISETPNPADKSIWSIKKVASGVVEEELVESEEIEIGFEESLLGLEEIAEDYFRPIERHGVSIPREDLAKLAELPLGDVIKTASSMLTILKPEEFQYLYISGEGHNRLAEKLADEGILFDLKGISLNDIEPLMEDMSDMLDESEFSTKAAAHLEETSSLRNLLNPFIVGKDPDGDGPKGAPLIPGILEQVIKAGISYAVYRIIMSRLNKAKSVMESVPKDKVPFVGKTVGHTPVVTGQVKVGSLYPLLAGGAGALVTTQSAVKKYQRGEDVSWVHRQLAENSPITAIGYALLASKAGKAGKALGGKIKVKSKKILRDLDDLSKQGSSENLHKFVKNASIVDNTPLEELTTLSGSVLDRDLFEKASRQIDNFREQIKPT